jgi:hypothetical protein
MSKPGCGLLLRVGERFTRPEPRRRMRDYVRGRGRPAMRSPGRPQVRRDVEREFWVRIAESLTSEDAAVACGVSGPVGSWWFRERDGMPSIRLGSLSGRYLSFAEREEIALLKVQGVGVREMARRLGRAPQASRTATAPESAGFAEPAQLPSGGRWMSPDPLRDIFDRPGDLPTEIRQVVPGLQLYLARSPGPSGPGGIAS